MLEAQKRLKNPENNRKNQLQGGRRKIKTLFFLYFETKTNRPLFFKKTKSKPILQPKNKVRIPFFASDGKTKRKKVFLSIRKRKIKNTTSLRSQLTRSARRPRLITGEVEYWGRRLESMKTMGDHRRLLFAGVMLVTTEGRPTRKTMGQSSS